MICRPILNVRNNFLIYQKLSIVLTHFARYTYLIGAWGSVVVPGSIPGGVTEDFFHGSF